MLDQLCGAHINHVLTLIRVYEETEEHIDYADEHLRDCHRLPEVHGSAHFRHEFDENHPGFRLVTREDFYNLR